MEMNMKQWAVLGMSIAMLASAASAADPAARREVELGKRKKDMAADFTASPPRCSSNARLRLRKPGFASIDCQALATIRPPTEHSASFAQSRVRIREEHQPVLAGDQ